MRPQQQNRRMRGRGGNNRKGPNPLTRSYESNGPDVKIRGTAQQVADKYAALARDAQSSGDRVMAENYLQHAEHYNRIIAAAQAQMQPQQGQRDNRDDLDDETSEREAAESNAPNSNKRQQPIDDGSGPQPEIEGMPAELALKDRASSTGKVNGHAEGTNGAVEEESKPAAPKRGRRTTTKSAEAEDAEEEKPARRTRRTRSRKSDENDAAEATGDQAPAAESTAPEEAVAQS